MDYRRRLARLRGLLPENDIDALFVTNLVNIRYLTGFTGTNAYFYIDGTDSWFFSDGRYAVQAGEQVTESEVRICLTHAEIIEALNKHWKSGQGRRLGFEGAAVTVKSAGPGWQLPPGQDKLLVYFEGAEPVPTAGLVEELRKVKDPHELDLIRAAADLGDKGYEYILGRIDAGRTEKDVALDLEFYMRRNGAEDVSFDPIVATAERSALPHAAPTDKEIEKGRYLMLDFGCKVEGYCSDMTRTIVVGRADERHRETYKVVLEAQQEAVALVGAGRTGHEVDAAARDPLKEAGFGDAFSHSLGHGVGLEIHEDPVLRPKIEEQLEPGHVVTIEPGVYFEGWGGVRIEDLLVVETEGSEVLSKSPKALMEL